MPAIETTTRSRLKTIAGTVDDLSAARIKLGQVELSASTEFLKNLVAEGPFLIINPASMNGLAENRLVDFEIVAYLYFGFPADADYDFSEIETIVFALRDAWLDSANFEDSSAPLNIVIPVPERRNDLKPVAGMYTITLSFRNC